MKVFCYHTPELTPTDPIPTCAVAIDVLRATTTIATVLASGAEAVQAFSDIDKLMAASENWPEDKRLRAGERGGAKVEGCDFGNSPLEYDADRVRDARLFLSTTNGTRALQRVENAPLLVTAALVNRQAVVNFLCDRAPDTVYLVGSGWQGSFSLEDTVCAGAIVASLLDRTDFSLEDLAGNDETVAALALYQQWRDRLVSLMKIASHGQRLLRLGNDADLEYCAKEDILDVLPIQKDKGVLVSS
ncbi:2-phosphosulfolactate phosphatase [Geitlerinema sp. FC II]|uniref:2-phosphosulfolactate phosphatase family protein n=1 Tax=Baaleninema simplex TaxID=2862350 RepID=UPI0003495AC2|nr:2-phosphosulfolactate phosphatase family protein [Baaleninema simplex]PPT04895.1 2-phosphosulfolactate phosphatase [Geitlerinema sp. FC II]